MSFLPAMTAFLAGLAAGAAYFGALWVAVRSFTGGGSALAFALGALLRLGLVAAALALAFALERPVAEVLAAGAGFVAARIAATRIGARQDGGQA